MYWYFLKFKELERDKYILNNALFTFLFIFGFFPILSLLTNFIFLLANLIKIEFVSPNFKISLVLGIIFLIVALVVDAIRIWWYKRND